MEEQQSLFFQCQLYVVELSEPVSLIEFNKEDMSNQLCQEQLSNFRHQISDQKTKMINPYNSNWANVLLNQNYNVQVRCNGNKWIIRKVTEDEHSKVMMNSISNLPKQGKLQQKTISKQLKQRVNKFIVDQHQQYIRQQQNGILVQQQNSSLPHLNAYNNNNNKNKYQNNENTIKIRQNSESSKQMPIFDINFIKNFQEYIV